MADNLIYIIRCAIALTLLYSLYGLLLRRETFHSLNRAILMSIVAGTMLLPFCTLHLDNTLPVVSEIGRVEEVVTQIAVPYSDDAVGISQPSILQLQGINLAIVCLCLVYYAGVVIFALRMIYRLFSLLWVVSKSRKIIAGGLTIRVSSHKIMPFSFFRWIVVGENDVQADCRGILEHEMVHVRQCHSMDVMIIESMSCLLWFHPFVWMLRKDLRDVHEYLADRHVISHGIDKDEYQSLLVEKATLSGASQIANSISCSSIKKRFIMMYRKPSSRIAALKSVYLLPLGLIAVMAFAKPRLIDDIDHDIRRAQATVAKTIDLLMKTPAEKEQHQAIKETSSDDVSVAVSEQATMTTRLPESTDTVATSIDIVSPLPVNKPVAVLDSIMLAIGAKKLNEGLFVGKFKPNYTSDTIRVARVILTDNEGKTIDGYTFGDETAMGCYVAELQTESNTELGKGFHLRRLTCNRPASQEYHDKRKGEQLGDSRLVPTDMTVREHAKRNENFFIEQFDDHTELIYYYNVPNDVEKVNINFDGFYIEDADSGDRYMLRSVKNFDSKQVNITTAKLRDMELKFTLVYPPLSKKVKNINVVVRRNGNTTYLRICKLKSVSRKHRNVKCVI